MWNARVFRQQQLQLQQIQIIYAAEIETAE
jgi:hypothetical protein